MQSNKTIIITTAILLLTILSAGCTDTGGANPETPKYTAPPEEVPVVEKTAAAETVPEPVETPWYASIKNAEVGTYSTMFGKDVYGVKNTASSGSSYDIFNIESSEQHILIHQEWNPPPIKTRPKTLVRPVPHPNRPVRLHEIRDNGDDRP